MGKRGDDDFARATTPMKDYNSNSMMMDVNEQAVIEVLQKCKRHGNIDSLQNHARIYTSAEGQIPSADLITCLTREGQVSELDARKVTLFLEMG